MKPSPMNFCKQQLVYWMPSRTKLVDFIIVLAIIATLIAPCGATLPGKSELTSLHGTMITMLSEDKGHAMEIWAKEDNVRAESSDDKHKTIIIQLGDTMYTYGTDSKRGMKQRFASGLASMGLIKQIATIKSKGKKESTREIEGVVYEQYSYEESRDASTDVWFEAKSSLPTIWLSAIKTGDKEISVMKMRYRDMEANVDVADELFKLPRDVTFSDEPVKDDSKETKGSPQHASGTPSQ
jgi:outer membrane lipoprotein-sorting protein